MIRRIDIVPVSPSVRIAIVLPTRNRSAMAQKAIESLLKERTPATLLLVSDNSTDPDEQQALEDHCRGMCPLGMIYVKSPSDLAMSEHWQFALDQCLSAFEPTHVAFITDRMIVRSGGLRKLAQALSASPQTVLSFRRESDFVDDSSHPIRLSLGSHSEQVGTLRSEVLLYRASRTDYSDALPRMLNTVVPVPVIEMVRAQFGSVFSSLAPDLNFAFRCLATVESIRFFDYAPAVHYGLSRSNGYAQAMGVLSKDALDFAQQEGASYLSGTPLPQVLTIHNFVAHEYNLVAAESRLPRFRELHLPSYYEALIQDCWRLKEPRVRERMLGLIADALSVSIRSDPRDDLPTRLRRLIRNPSILYGRVWRPFAGSWSKSLWIILARFDIRPATTKWMRFRSTEEALRFAQVCSVRRNPDFEW